MMVDTVSCRDALPFVIAVLTVLAAAVLLPQTVTAQAATCGDGVCDGNESFDSCFEDCASTEAKETRDLLDRAIEEVQMNEAGYEELQQALESWDDRDFEAVERYAGEALALNRYADTAEDGETRLEAPEVTTTAAEPGQDRSLYVWILAGIAAVIVVVVFWLYGKRRGVQRLQRSTGTSPDPEHDELSRRLGELVMRIGEKLEQDVDLDQDELLQEIDRAYDRLDEGKHAEAVELVEDIEERIHEASEDD